TAMGSRGIRPRVPARDEMFKLTRLRRLHGILPAMSSGGQIDVYRQTVRHALANAFNHVDPGEHAWRGSIGLGEATVAADVALLDDGRPYVAVHADIAAAETLDGNLARMLVMENANTTIGRLAHRDGKIRIEHAILAGTTMANVEIKASVWAVGWTAHAFA